MLRRHWTRLVALLTRVLGDLDVAEDALGNALVEALEAWPQRGVPANPEGWLVAVARRRGIDRLRRAQRGADKLRLLAVTSDLPPDPDQVPSSIPDERLRLVFTCCHPALDVNAQVALSLRYLCGLAPAEVARLHAVSETALAARLTRAKHKIAAAGVPYRVPRDAELLERLSGVLGVVYLLFTSGYAATSGEALVRADLCDRALDMARLLADLLPDEPDVAGLLALLLLTDSRRATRVDAEGRLVGLDDQDRSRWDRAKIGAGLGLLRRALAADPPGRYAIQAAIAAEHARADRASVTDWAAIVAWYELLRSRHPAPVVELNHAAAVAMALGPAEGLALLDDLRDEPTLARSHRLHGARAELLRRLGRTADAIACYGTALRLAGTEVERDFYRRQREKLTVGASLG